MVWIAGALLPTTLIIGTTRDTALSLSLRANPANSLMRVLGAMFWLVLYRFSVQNGVAFVNVLTNTMLSWPTVAQGLHRTVLVMFGASAVFGGGGAFLGLLGLAALTFAITMFALKVLLLMVLAILYVSGPLFIGLTPLPTIGYLARGWLLALTGICLIPVGWCLIFATAGAISLDVTSLGNGAHISARVIGAFAAVVTYYLAYKWPVLVLGHVRSSLGGLGVRTGGSGASGGGPKSNGALAAKAQRARTGLQGAMLAGGRGMGLAAGQLGAPRGGLVGLAGRQAAPRVAVAASTAAIAAGPPRPTGSATSRLGRAGETLRATPGRMKAAWTSAATPGPGASGGGRPRRPTSPGQTGAKTTRRSRKGNGANPPTGGAVPGPTTPGSPRARRAAANPTTPPAQRAPTNGGARKSSAGSPPAPGAGGHTPASPKPAAANRQVTEPARPRAQGATPQKPSTSTTRHRPPSSAQTPTGPKGRPPAAGGAKPPRPSSPPRSQPPAPPDQ
jgi:hypothetical protein